MRGLKPESPRPGRGKKERGFGRNRLLTALLAVCWALAIPSGAARAKGSSILHVTGKVLQPTYHHEYDTARIQAMSGIRAPSRAAQEPGLTLFEYELSSQYEMGEKAKDPRGPFRIWAKSIQVNFSMTRMEVFVSSQYPVGSCQYAAILAHENTHVAINERVFKKYKAILEGQLRRVERSLPSLARPLRAGSEAQGEAALDQKLKPLFQSLEARFAAEVKRENAKIDTPASYARTQAKCKGW